MGHLTNGSFSYERRVKTGDFEHKHAAVTIHYALDEGDDANEVLARARTLVVQHVHQAVGIKPAVEAAPKDPAVVIEPVHRGRPTVEVVVPEKPFLVVPAAQAVDIIADSPVPVTNLKTAKRAVKKRAPVLISTAAEIDMVADMLENAPTPAEEILDVVPTSIVVEDPTVGPVVGETPSAGPSLVGDDKDPQSEVVTGSSVPSSELVGETSPTSSEIVDDFTATDPAASDAELGVVLSRVNAKLKDRPRIQALIGEFVEQGQSFTKIPDVRRAEFILRLEALG